MCLHNLDLVMADIEQHIRSSRQRPSNKKESVCSNNSNRIKIMGKWLTEITKHHDVARVSTNQHFHDKSTSMTIYKLITALWILFKPCIPLHRKTWTHALFFFPSRHTLINYIYRLYYMTWASNITARIHCPSSTRVSYRNTRILLVEKHATRQVFHISQFSATIALKNTKRICTLFRPNEKGTLRSFVHGPTSVNH